MSAIDHGRLPNERKSGGDRSAAGSRAIRVHRRWAFAMSCLSITLAFAMWTPGMVGIAGFSSTFAVPFLIGGAVLPAATFMNVLGYVLLPRRGVGLLWDISLASTVALFAAISMSVSPEPLRAFRVIVPMMYAVPVSIIAVAASRFCWRGLRGLMTIIILMGSSITLVAIIMSHIPALRPIVMGSYRLAGLFDNANQYSIVIASISPLVLFLYLSERPSMIKAALIASYVLFAYALILTGGKTGLALFLVGSVGAYLIHAAAAKSVVRSIRALFLAGAFGGIAALVLPSIILKLSPILYSKLSSIFVGGVSSYQSISSRQMLWNEALRLGVEHPLTGSGAGAYIHGVTHAHNMVLDLFRGTGVFGASAVLLICVTCFSRLLSLSVRVIGTGELRRNSEFAIAMYAGASLYLVGNQLSDSFSPSTSLFFWTMYFGAFVLMCEVPSANFLQGQGAGALKAVGRPTGASDPVAP